MQETAARVITAVILGSLFLLTYFYSQNLFSLLLFCIFLMILIFEWPGIARVNKKIWLLVPVYPLSPILSLMYLNHVYRSVNFLIPLYPFFVSWTADSFAYFAGRSFGRHKISPSISPKKTWEGLLGSFLGVITFNFSLTYYSPFFGSLYFLSNSLLIVIMSIIFAIFAFFGDLFESYLKRKANLKDSGILLFTHGGLLDRFDSVFFVVIVFLFLIKYYSCTG